MAIGVLRALAARATAPVFAAIGAGGEEPVSNLHGAADLTFVSSIRQASVLLVVGRLRGSDHDALRRVHDQMPHPRATLWWGQTPLVGFADPVTIAVGEDATLAIRRLFHEVITNPRSSEPDLLSDEPPNPWRGRGKNGQGGDGMMGGTPYGRPMAMTDGDLRDGLSLDSFTITLGPFLPQLPPGLAIELTLQGDVVQKATMVQPPHKHGSARADALRYLARMLALLELPELGRRCRRVAHREDWSAMPALRRRIIASGVFAAIPTALGDVDGRDVRDRLDAWLDEAQHGIPEGGGRRTVETVLLADLLPGLEWHEAMLVINSFPADAFAAAARSESHDTNGTSP